MVEKLTLSWRRAASPGKRHLGVLSRGALRVLQNSAIGSDERPGEIRASSYRCFVASQAARRAALQIVRPSTANAVSHSLRSPRVSAYPDTGC